MMRGVAPLAIVEEAGMIALTAALMTSAGLLCLPPRVVRRPIPTDSYTSVPLKSGRTKGHIWVECEVGGRTVNLVVDTGAGQTCIVPGLAARLNLRLGPLGQGLLADGSRVETRPAEVSLKLGA